MSEVCINLSLMLRKWGCDVNLEYSEEFFATKFEPTVIVKNDTATFVIYIIDALKITQVRLNKKYLLRYYSNFESIEAENKTMIIIQKNIEKNTTISKQIRLLDDTILKFNLEFFGFDLLSHYLQPSHIELIQQNDIVEFVAKYGFNEADVQNFAKVEITDVIVRYFNGHIGDLMHYVRTTSPGGHMSVLRLIIPVR